LIYMGNFRLMYVFDFRLVLVRK
ncbi:unnamed protein product, partial [Rotaria magnacalcarata]